MRYTITVINLHGLAALPDGAIYVGRPSRKYKGSPLANPNPLRTESDRPRVLASYKQWIGSQLALPRSPACREFDRLVQLARQQDLVLACWCNPKGCHADYIKELIEQEINRHAG